MRTISGCRHLKVNLKAKIYIYVNSTTQRCPNKFFCLKIFSICTLSREYLREFSKTFEMAVMVYSHAWGKLIHEKKQKSKISWHCPFKRIWIRFTCVLLFHYKISLLFFRLFSLQIFRFASLE